MPPKSHIAETRELAFQAWRQCGQNIEQTIRELQQAHKIPVSKPTIYAWMEKYSWKERAARVETEEKRINDVVVSGEGKILADLEKQKAKYERFFETLPDTSPDNQAMYAYTNLVKTIVDIKTKTNAVKALLFTEFLRDLVEWLSKNDPSAVTVIEQNFDDFITFAKEKYAR